MVFCSVSIYRSWPVALTAAHPPQLAVEVAAPTVAAGWTRAVIGVHGEAAWKTPGLSLQVQPDSTA